MVRFATEKLMALEVGARTGASYDEKSATAIAIDIGKREPALLNCVSQAADRQLLPQLPRTASYGREGSEGRHPGGLYPEHLDASRP